MNPEVADALLVAAYEWAKSGSILKSTSWTTQDAMAMMAGRPVENKRELNACMTSGFQIYVSTVLNVGIIYDKYVEVTQDLYPTHDYVSPAVDFIQ